MIIVNCENKKLETCLKKYRQKLDRIGQTDELKRRKTYEKPSEKKRSAKLAAKYRRQIDGDSKI